MHGDESTALEAIKPRQQGWERAAGSQGLDPPSTTLFEQPIVVYVLLELSEQHAAISVLSGEETRFEFPMEEITCRDICR